MRCDYFDAGRCRSCSDLATPYVDQLAAKQVRARLALESAGAHDVSWLAPLANAEAGFRNKAKMVVGGTVDAPTLGILDEHGHGVDLRACPLYSPAMHELLPLLAEVVTRAALTPYDVPLRSGELKHVLVTESPDGGFLVRWVLRSAEPVDRLRAQLPWLLERAPHVAVVSVNLQPEHKAVLEGPEEVVLTERDALPMRVSGADGPELLLRPRSFFQTSTPIAAALYAQAAAWVDEVGARSVLDLYCGVGGFALHLARPGRRVLGVEVSAEAVESATAAARAAGLDDVEFRCGDATQVGDEQVDPPDVVVVNPPRRGLGRDLCGWLEAAPARHLVYSSCNVDSLARDLAALPSWRVTRAQVLDMFPHTGHFELLTLLDRR